MHGDDELTFCSSIVYLVKGMVPLLTSCVPDYQLHLTSLYIDCLFQVTSIPSTLLCFIELIPCESYSQRCFPDSRYQNSKTKYLQHIPDAYLPSPSTTILCAFDFFSILLIFLNNLKTKSIYTYIFNW